MALTKSTTIQSVDAWQTLSAATIVDGTAKDVSSSYYTLAYLEIALIEATATDGCEGWIEVSYGDDDWIKLSGSDFKGTAETAGTTTINDASVSAGDTTITLTDATTADFDVKGRKWFIKDGTIANSESVVTKSVSTNTVTVLQDLMRSHADSLNVYDRVDEWTFVIPFGCAYYRFVINNVDADCDVAWRSFVSLVTSMS
jgi:hypothetical protein